MTITQKSPKRFRYTFVSRLQNLSLSIIENLYRANDVFVSKGDLPLFERRTEYQHSAMTDARLLCYFALLASEHGCILPKQYEQIARQGTDCMNLIGAWINSDRKRLSSG